jgi:hypothetical protein
LVPTLWEERFDHDSVSYRCRSLATSITTRHPQIQTKPVGKRDLPKKVGSYVAK